MSFGIHVERTLDGRRIEPGAVWTQPMHQLRFQTVVVCDAVNPDVWHGEVRLGQNVVITTGQVDSYERASQQARDAFEEKIVELLRG